MFGLLTAYILVPKQGGYIFRLFSYLGKKSLIIYALHFYFPQGVSTGYLLVTTSTIFGVVSSLALGYILEKSKTLSTLLFGSRG